MPLRTDSKNPIPFPSEDAFRQTLNALAQSRFVYVNKQGNLSRAHTFSLFALSRIFSLLKSRGAFDRALADRRLVELKVMQFLHDGKDWLLPKDLKLMMTLAQKAGLTHGKRSEDHPELNAFMKLLAQEITEKRRVQPEEYQTLSQKFQDKHTTLLTRFSRQCARINAVCSVIHPKPNQLQNEESSAQEEEQGGSDYDDESHASFGRGSDHQGREKEEPKPNAPKGPETIGVVISQLATNENPVSPKTNPSSQANTQVKAEQVKTENSHPQPPTPDPEKIENVDRALTPFTLPSIPLSQQRRANNEPVALELAHSIGSVAMINVGMHQPEVLKLNQNLDSGASGCPVFLGTRDGKEVIVKLVHENEAVLSKELTRDNHEYVIKCIDSIIYNDFKKLDNDGLITEFVLRKSYIEALVMEKLSLANFYNEKESFQFEHALDPRYARRYNDILNITHDLKLDNNTIRHMIECVENIEYMHSKNISHGDIKLGNLGIDEKGRVKFFDFGEACKVKDTDKEGYHKLNPKKNDVIALGKLFINMMAGKALITVGRHYISSRTIPAECHKEALFQRLVFANMDVKVMIEKMLDFESEYEEHFLKDVIEQLKKLEQK